MYEIRSDIPAPVIEESTALRVATLMHQMNVNEYFDVPHSKRKNLSFCVWSYKNRYPGKNFKSKTIILDDGTKVTRLWRMMDSPDVFSVMRGAGEPILKALRELPVGKELFLLDASVDSLMPYYESCAKGTWESAMMTRTIAGKRVYGLRMKRLLAANA